MEKEVPSGDVKDQGQSQPQEDTKGNVTAEQTDAQEVKQSEETQLSTPAEGASEVQEEVDEKGVPWKNRAMEFQRKFENATNQINAIQGKLPELIEQSVRQATTKVQEESTPKYTISQLEAFAQENPEQRPWVEEQKALIIQNKVIEATQAQYQKTEKEKQNQVVRQQSEQWVFNKPKFQECFMTDPMGRKVWNPNHPLTQMIGMYMNEPDVKARPDALLVAAKLAYADYMDVAIPQTQKVVKDLKRQTKRLEKQTLVEGGGVSTQQTGSDAYQKAKKQQAATGNIKDTAAAVRKYFEKIGVIKE